MTERSAQSRAEQGRQFSLPTRQQTKLVTRQRQEGERLQVQAQIRYPCLPETNHSSLCRRINSSDFSHAKWFGVAEHQHHSRPVRGTRACDPYAKLMNVSA